MSKLWDDLKDNMKDWSVTAVEKAEEMSKIAVAKTEEMTRISKVKFEIHQLYREMNKVYENLGKLVFEHTKTEHMASFSGNKDFFNLIYKIEDFDFGFSLVDEAELEAVQKAASTAEAASSTAMEMQTKIDKLYNMIMPLLNNLQQNPEKEYIYWPNRIEKLQEQVDKVLELTRG